MKCDKLKPLVFSLKDLSFIDEPAVQKNFENPHDHAVYKATEVDEAIAELKQKLAEKESWVKMLGEGEKTLSLELEKTKQKLEDAQATAYAESVDAGMENRRLKRALWLAREQTAIEKHNHFALCHNHSTDLYLCINGASIPTESSTTMRLSSEWSMIWKRVVAKCRAKAKEYL